MSAVRGDGIVIRPDRRRPSYNAGSIKKQPARTAVVGPPGGPGRRGSWRPAILASSRRRLRPASGCPRRGGARERSLARRRWRPRDARGGPAGYAKARDAISDFGMERVKGIEPSYSAWKADLRPFRRPGNWVRFPVTLRPNSSAAGDFRPLRRSTAASLAAKAVRGISVVSRREGREVAATYVRERCRLTADHVRRAQALVAAGKVVGRGQEWADDKVAGLILRAQRGTVTWYLKLRTTTLRIGPAATFSLDEARDQATQARLQHKRGENARAARSSPTSGPSRPARTGTWRSWPRRRPRGRRRRRSRMRIGACTAPGCGATSSRSSSPRSWRSSSPATGSSTPPPPARRVREHRGPAGREPHDHGPRTVPERGGKGEHRQRGPALRPARQGGPLVGVALPRRRQRAGRLPVRMVGALEHRVHARDPGPCPDRHRPRPHAPGG